MPNFGRAVYFFRLKHIHHCFIIPYRFPSQLTVSYSVRRRPLFDNVVDKWKLDRKLMSAVRVHREEEEETAPPRNANANRRKKSRNKRVPRKAETLLTLCLLLNVLPRNLLGFGDVGGRESARVGKRLSSIRSDGYEWCSPLQLTAKRIMSVLILGG
ncbi:hypothetical protein GWI33_005872 [Rhynchophorus ferrugineus]|uniref:Uncharacterized protein n=1 Tax=Rhynchophorus ferrugineus TaxID=354439 RepID=A0A834IGR3_RHYFE|nr:hypothetical protein GWI33_005872 [Rhynchophorus ferrugineus]